MDLTKRIHRLVQELGPYLINRSWKIVLAESCTGGALASLFTQCAGSSEWFDYGIVCYSNFSKRYFLGVSASILENEGAVSHSCALKMVEGVCLQDNFFGVSLTGFAGPLGGTLGNPVGTVYLAWKAPGYEASALKFEFCGSRKEVIQQALFYALKGSFEKILYPKSFYNLNYFFALSIDSSLLQTRLFKVGLDYGLTIEQLEPMANLHLTLLYIGKINQEKILHLQSIASILCANTKTFSITLQNPNYWSKSHAFVIEPSYSKTLEGIANKLKEECNVDDKRVFKPHVTLAKQIKVSSEENIATKLEIKWVVSHLSLFVSFHGAFYFEQCRWNFLTK